MQRLQISQFCTSRVRQRDYPEEGKIITTPLYEHAALFVLSPGKVAARDVYTLEFSNVRY
jgi:hypothetical protein